MLEHKNISLMRTANDVYKITVLSTCKFAFSSTAHTPHFTS